MAYHLVLNNHLIVLRKLPLKIILSWCNFSIQPWKSRNECDRFVAGYRHIVEEKAVIDLIKAFLGHGAVAEKLTSWVFFPSWTTVNVGLTLQ